MSTRELLIKRYLDELPGLKDHLKDPWLLDQCDYLARKVLLYSKFREEVLASLNELALDRGTHERLEMGFYACLEIGAAIGSLREMAVAGEWAFRGEKADINLKPHRDRLAAEADEFWEDWRRLYWQLTHLFDETHTSAIAKVRGEMIKRNAANPRTRKVPSERRCWDQLLREPTVDWKPEPIH